jgi:extracellular elastinolytic metalloproteinase
MNKRSKRGAVAILATTATALTMAGGVGATAASSSSGAKSSESPIISGRTGHETKGYYDSRTANPKAVTRQATQVVEAQGKAYDTFTRSLGVQGVVNTDPLTGTPREVAKLNGFLTTASSGSARSIVLNYVRAHLSVFGLSKADLGTFRLSNDYVDVLGTHHLSWEQYAHGIPVFGNDDNAVSQNEKTPAAGNSERRAV